MVLFLLKDCCDGRPEVCIPLAAELDPSCPPAEPCHDRPDATTCFSCAQATRARSILAESILRKDGAPRFNAFSAGSQPKGDRDIPLAFKVLESYGYPTDGFRSKNWDEFAAPGAPQMDFIFTVCDSAAGEACPIWPGHPATAHWGIDDPAHAEGTELEKEAAFVTAFKHMKNRISVFIALPLASLDRMALSSHLADIGRQEGARQRRRGTA